MLLVLYALLGFAGLSKSLEDVSVDECPCTLYNNTDTADCSSREISEIPDCVPISTIHLNLASNDLKYQFQQFKRFKNLVSLNLSGNRWYDPKNDSFAGLSELQILYLNQTNFKASAGVFNGLTSLETLYLNENSDDLPYVLSENLFNGLANLLTLDLSGNRFYIQNSLFARLHSLIHLDLSKSEVFFQSKHSFAGLAGLTHLSLSNSYWYTRDTPDDLFQFLKSLEELNIEGFCSDNLYSCSEIDKLLQNVVTLKILHLHNVILENNLGQGFSYLKQLEKLHFVNSQVKFLHRRMCQIKHMDVAVFTSLMNIPLSKVVIHGCLVEYFSGYVISPVQKTLECIDLILSTSWCDDLYSPLATGLKKSNIKKIRLSADCQFSGSIHEPLLIGLEETHIESLDLSYGPIEMISSLFTAHLPTSLSELYLNNNKITFIDTKPFRSLQNLSVLDLSNQDEMHMAPKMNTLIVRSGDCKPFPYSLISLNVSQSSLMCMVMDALCGKKLFPDNVKCSQSP